MKTEISITVWPIPGNLWRAVMSINNKDIGVETPTEAKAWLWVKEVINDVAVISTNKSGKTT